ncbi:MAG TPA: UvrD-helicase domain-containing protein, partial [Bacillota bacterium]
MKRWTPAQEAAIYTRGSDLLVAAGAGAGKTAVLVERVLARITDDVAPVDVDHLLVVTFTEAAAAEMRARIAARLEERLRNEPGNHHLERQLLLLPRATIATIHAFCLRVLRQNFERLGLDPAFRVLDENAAAILSFDALDEVLERRFAASAAGLEQAGEGHDDAFLALVDRFGGATGEGLVPLVLSLHRLAMTQPDPEGWLDELLEPFAVPPPGEPGGAGEGDAAATAGAERWLKELRELAAAGIEQALSYVQHAQALCRLPDGPAGYLATLDADAAMLAELRAAADGPWLSFTAALQASSFGRLQALKGGSVDTELRERVKALRERAKRELDSLSRGLGARSLPEAIAQLAELRPMLEVLVQLVREFDERYRRAKEAAGAVDFNDLERLCLKLLSEPGDWRRPSDVARRLADRYVEVIVDEYQ